MSNEVKAMLETFKAVLFGSFLAGIAYLIFNKFSIMAIALYLLIGAAVYLIHLIYKFNLQSMQMGENRNKF